MDQDTLRKLVDIICFQQDLLSELLRELSVEERSRVLHRIPSHLPERIAHLLVELRTEVGAPRL